VQGVTMKKG